MSHKNSPQRNLHRLPNSVYAATEYAFYFTLCARHHGQPFLVAPLGDSVVGSLLWTRTNYNWHSIVIASCRIICISLLDSPEPTPNCSILRGGMVSDGILEHLRRFKSFTTNAAWKLGFKGQLWQKSSYDRVLDMEKPLEEIVQYVLDNPVRKGLVAEWSHWRSGIVDAWR